MKSLEKAKVREEKIYSKLQTAILKKMQEAKESNFSKPWINPFFENAHNPFSKSIYRGFNQFMLSFECEDKNYSVNRWMTFKQAKEIGGNVKKGCASFEIIFYSFLYKKDGKYISQEKVKMLKLKTGKSLTELNISSSAFIKFYNVFNVEQIENLPTEYYELKKVVFDTQPIQKAEELFLSTGAELITKNSDKAFYHRTNDNITIPLISQFENNEDYYNVLFHELSHWTGAEKRLNRTKGIVFGDKDYAKEELVAELTTAFVNNAIGLSSGITKNVDYLNTWFSAVKRDVKYFISASALAQKSADYIFHFSEQKEQLKTA